MLIAMKAVSKIMSGLATLALRALALLPLSVLYALSDLGYYVLRYVVRYRRDVVRENLRLSFPEKSENELRAIERDFYRNFADNAVETVKMLHISDKQMMRRMKFENVEIIDELFSQGRDIVAYFSHCGNWEWATSVGLHCDPEDAGKVDFGFVYRPMKNEEVDRLLLTTRTRFKSTPYPKATVLRHLIRLRRSGCRFITGFMSDQKPSHGDPTQVLMFLNHPTAMITGTETLARKLDTAAIYWDMEKVSRGHYRVTCRMLAHSVAAEKPGTLTAAYAACLQDTIRRQPSIWLWSHKRWKIPVTMPCE